MNIIERIDEYLSANGFPHHIDEDGEIVVTYLGRTIICGHDEDDEMYVRFIMPVIYEIEDNENDEAAAEYIYLLKVCNRITAVRKCVKAFVANNKVHLNIECYFDPDSNFEQNIKRIFSILNETYFDFHSIMSNNNDDNDNDNDDDNDDNE